MTRQQLIFFFLHCQSEFKCHKCIFLSQRSVRDHRGERGTVSRLLHSSERRLWSAQMFAEQWLGPGAARLINFLKIKGFNTKAALRPAEGEGSMQAGKWK